jgi:hypothetical protein
MTATEIRAETLKQIKETALWRGAYTNSRGRAYLVYNKAGTKVHAVADTELEEAIHPKRYRNLWLACNGQMIETSETQGFGWADVDDIDRLGSALCQNCRRRLVEALLEGRLS